MLGPRADQPLRDERQDHHQQDRKSRTFEETPHEQKKSAYQGSFAPQTPERGDVIEVAVALGMIEAVADCEAIGNLEPDVARGEVDSQALGLGKSAQTSSEAGFRARRFRIK